MFLRAAVFDFDGTLARPSLDFPLMRERIAQLAGEYLALRGSDVPTVSNGLLSSAPTRHEWAGASAPGSRFAQSALPPLSVLPASLEAPLPTDAPAFAAPASAPAFAALDALPALEWIEAAADVLGPHLGDAFRFQAHALIATMEHEAAQRTSLFPFARPLLLGLEARGVAVGIITRNNRASVQAVFPDAPAFTRLVLTREDVAAVKPDPTHLLAALEQIGASPEASLMVGDHPSDVLTARRAGTRSAAVASGGTTLAALEREAPDLLLQDAGELLEMLAARGWLPS